MAQADSTREPLRRVAAASSTLRLGGSITFLCNLTGELVRRGVPAHVWSFADARDSLAADFSLRQVPVQFIGFERLIFEDYIATALRSLAQWRPTIYLANLGPDSFELLRYLPPGVFRVGMVQSDDPVWYAMLRHYHAHLDLVAAVSQRIKAKVEAMPEFARTKVAYLPYGVPMPEQANLVRAASEPLRILYFGRVEQEQKRVRLFPAIFRQLQESGIPFHWTIAGDGPERPALEAALRSSRPDQTVTFTGTVGYQQVPGILAAHDVFLLASDYEGLPLSLLEAMGHGLVPVVSDLPSGIREVVDAGSGRLVDPAVTPGYAREIVWLHEHRAEMTALAAHAREKVWREFSVRAMTDRWLATLPAPDPAAIVWPQRWSIRAPLAAKASPRFWPVARVVRRLLKKATAPVAA